MSFEELRSLVVELVELELEPEPDDDPVAEFDTQPTTYRPTKGRASTLDDLIAWLRTAPSPQPTEAGRRIRRRL